MLSVGVLISEPLDEMVSETPHDIVRTTDSLNRSLETLLGQPEGGALGTAGVAGGAAAAADVAIN